MVVATYRKIHVFGYGGEAELMSAGDELVVVDTPLGPTGLATCYDTRFPEQFRALAERGAQAFLITSGWPTKRIEAWDVLVQARAIEDQAWVIACNQVGMQKGVPSVATARLWIRLARWFRARVRRRPRCTPPSIRQPWPTWRQEFPALRDIVELAI